MVDTTWTNGGGDGKASNPANWSNGIDVGYNVIFDGTSTANCTFDYDGQLGTFTIGAGYTGTITQSSDMYISGFSQAGGIFTPSNSKYIYGSGTWTRTGGVWPSYLGNVIFTDNATNSLGGFSFNNLWINAEKTFTSSDIHNIRNKLYIYGTLINTGTIQLDWQSMGSSCIVGNGDIQNSGLIKFRINSMNYQINYSKPLGNVQITNYDSSDNKITALSDLNIGTLTYSVGATYTCTLDLNGHSLTASSITIGTRGILSNSAATDSVIACNSFDSSAGTFTEANTQVILNGNGTLKTGAHKFDELVQRDNVTTTLGSDITVTNEFDTAGSFINGAYSITHENPEKRLIAPMINPIVRNPKRSPFFNNRFTRNIEIEVI